MQNSVDDTERHNHFCTSKLSNVVDTPSISTPYTQSPKKTHSNRSRLDVVIVCVPFFCVPPTETTHPFFFGIDLAMDKKMNALSQTNTNWNVYWFSSNISLFSTRSVAAVVDSSRRLFRCRYEKQLKCTERLLATKTANQWISERTDGYMERVGQRKKWTIEWTSAHTHRHR